MPEHSLMFVPLENADESYYLCSILNSSVFLSAVASYSYEIGSYGQVIEYSTFSDNVRIAS